MLGGHGWRLAASMAAHVAATPAGVKATWLAMGISLGATAAGWMRESSLRVGVGWDVGGRVAVSSDMGIASRPVSR